MTVLSGRIIKERLETSDLNERLVVSPLLECDEQLRSDQASVDIRLGFEFALVTPSSFGIVDEFSQSWEESSESMLKDLYERCYVPLGEKIVIHPHQFILAETLEYLRLPYDMMAYVVGRSTWGRLGLIVATAIGIHPGFAGALTLELRNLGEAPLILHPGQSIAQLFFHFVEGAKTTSDANNQYGVSDILPRKMSASTTHKKINKLRHK